MGIIEEFYSKYDEDKRLTSKNHLPEYLITMKFIEKYLFPSAKIAEIGAGTGRYSVALAEKGYADYRVSVTAKGGHSSQPPVHTAIGELAEVIRDIERHQFNGKMPDFVYDLFTKIGKNVSYPARIVTCNLWLLKPLVTFVMKKIPPAASLIRTTTGVTMAEGSPAANVLPQKASITINQFPNDARRDDCRCGRPYPQKRAQKKH